MKLIRTNLSWEGKRIWLENADASQAAQLEYRCGEVGTPAHLTKESDGQERRTAEIVHRPD